MLALRAHHRGGPEQLALETVPRPEPETASVLVNVHAAAVTFDELRWDETWLRDGQDRTPITPSHEWSGVVEEAHPSTGFATGDEVFGMVPFDQDGAAAEYVVVPPEFIATKPTTLTHVQAAALPLAGLTAWQGLVEYGRVDVGDRVLVLGAAGGVGALAVQFALQLGAQVTATTMSRDVDYVQALGLVEVLVSDDRGSHSPAAPCGRLRRGARHGGWVLDGGVHRPDPARRNVHHAAAAAAHRASRGPGSRRHLLRRPFVAPV